MLLFSKKPWYQRLFDHIRKNGKVRMVFLLTILLVALGFFVLFTQDILDQYLSKRDAIASFLPQSTALYIHVPGNNQPKLQQQLQTFFDFHPRAREQWLDSLSEDFLNHWPSVEQIVYQELGFALIPVEDGFEPALLVYGVQGDIEPQVQQWRKSGYAVAVEKDDALYIISTSSYKQLFDAHQDSLAEYMQQQHVALLNHAYAYIGLSQVKKLSRLSEYAFAQPLLEQFSRSQNWVLLTMNTVDGMLVLSENQAPLTQPEIEVSPTWVDSVQLENSLVIKNVLINELFEPAVQEVLSNQSQALTTVYRLLSLHFSDQENWLFHEQQRFSLAISWPTSEVESGVTDTTTKPTILASTYMHDAFDMNVFQQSFLRLAAYDFPDEVSKQLVDGTYITEYRAQIHDGIEIHEESIADSVKLYTVQHDAINEWHWVYAVFQDQLFISNSKPALVRLFTDYSTVSKSSTVCTNLDNSYIAYDLPADLAAQVGLERIISAQVNEELLLCIR